MKSTVFILSRHENVVNTVSLDLREHNCSCLSTDNIRNFWSMLSRSTPDIIIFDSVNGDIDKINFICELRRKHDSIGLLIILPDYDEDSRLSCLEAGADGYLVHGFGMREMRAKIKSILRRVNIFYAKLPDQSKNTHSVYYFEDFIFSPRERTLRRCNGIEVNLALLEFNLLNQLILRSGTVLSRDFLSEILEQNNKRNIDVTVNRLRNKIEPRPHIPSIIKTVRGAGYILGCSVDVKNITDR